MSNTILVDSVPEQRLGLDGARRRQAGERPAVEQQEARPQGLEEVVGCRQAPVGKQHRAQNTARPGAGVPDARTVAVSPTGTNDKQYSSGFDRIASWRFDIIS